MPFAAVALVKANERKRERERREKTNGRVREKNWRDITFTGSRETIAE